jgi:peptidoglycan biosynthesis protein MviN/MurJ (putative lipid II flippase)
VNCFENAMNVVLALVLFPRFGVQGLALAYAAAYLCAAVVALVLLARRIGATIDAPTVRVSGRAALATVALAVVAAPVAGVVGSADAAHAAAAAVLGTLAGGTVYLVGLRVLGVPEIGTILGILRRRRAPATPNV